MINRRLWCRRSLLSVLLPVLLLVSTAGAVNSGKSNKSLAELEANLKNLERSIEVTRAKMKEVKDVTFLPDLYFVLAEMHVDKARTLFVVEQLKNPGTPSKELNNLDAYKAKKQAIEIYQRFADNFPKHESLDKAYFFIAHEFREMSNSEEMIKAYQKIVKDFPNSAYWEESQMILGDYFLEQKKDPQLGLELYQKILQRRPGPFTPMAHYKIGWCYINLSKFFEALMSFEAVLTLDSQIDLSNLPEIYKKMDIRTDSLLAMVWPYSEQVKIDPDRADPLTYFERLSPSRVVLIRVLNRLTTRLTLKKRLDDSIPVYARLLDVSSNSEDNVSQIMAMYAALRASKKAWPLEQLPAKLSEVLVRVRYDSHWKAVDKARVEKNFEVILRDWATTLHKKSTANKGLLTPTSKKSLADTAEAYRVYLNLFPTSKSASAIELNLAETEFGMQDFSAAGLLYEKLLVKSTLARQKELMSSAIQSYALALKKKDELSRVELMQSREGFREIGAKFVASYPRDPACPMIYFNIARTHYDERNFEQAVTGFNKFIGQFPGHKEATTAGQLILDSYNQREEYDNMIKAGKALIGNSQILDSQFKKDVGELIRQAEYRKVTNLAGDPRSREYAQKLLGFAQKYQGSNLGDQALYEAFVTLRTKKDFQLFVVGEQLLQKHGDSKYAKEVVSQMGNLAASMGDYRRAAKYYEIFAKKYPQDPVSKGLLASAAQIRELTGDFEMAASNQKELGNWDQVVKLYVSARKWAQVGQVLAAKPQNSIEETYWFGLSLHRQGNQDAAKSHLQKAAAMRANTFEEKTMAAHALFLIAANELKSFKAIQLGQGDEAALVKTKSDKLIQLTKQLNQVITYGNGKWIIASLYELGRANNEFASFVEHASLPAGLTADQQKQYKQLVAQQAGQYKAKANDFFANCAKSAEQFEVFTSFVLGCQSRGSLDVTEENDEKNFPSNASSNGELDSAKEKELRKQLLDQPKNTKLLMELGALAVEQKDYPVAMLLFKKIIEIDSRNSDALSAVGVTLLYLNDLEGGADTFKAALKINTKEPRALLGLGSLYHKFVFSNKLKGLKARLDSVKRPINIKHPWMTQL